MRTRLASILAIVIINLAIAAPAGAQAPPQPGYGYGRPPGYGPAPAPPGPARKLALTFSPVLLLGGPIIEVTGELRVGPKLGAAVIVGAGQFTSTTTSPGQPDVTNTFDVLELGASGRYYLTGDFDGGIQLGGQAKYIKLSGDDVNGTGISAIGEGLAVGPLVGWKHTWHFGLTFDAQLGVAYLLLAASADDGSSANDSRISPILNLNVGWSF
jgi:hypothetical protein